MIAVCVTGMYTLRKHRLLYEHSIMVCRTEIYAMGKYDESFWDFLVIMCS